MREVDVAVVTVTWNSAAVIGDLLDSLPAAMGDCSYVVVVADNASSDDTLAIVATTAPAARRIQVGRNAGYAAGINAGISAAEPSRAVVVINPDVRLGKGAVAALISALDASDVGVVVPMLRAADGQLTCSLRRDPTVLRALGEALLGGDRAGRHQLLGETVTDPRVYELATDVDWGSGAVMAISRSCIDAVGEWDESFWLYAEETDFCLRARDAGFRVRYEPAARAMHIEGEAAENPYLWTTLTTNRVRLFRKRHGKVHSAVFWGAVTLNEAIRAVAGRQTSRAALRELLRPGAILVPPGPAPSATTSAH